MGVASSLLVGDSPDFPVNGYAFPKAGIDDMIHPSAQIVEIRSQVQPRAGHGVGDVGICPGKGNVIFLVGVHQGVQLCGVIVPANFVVFYGEAIFFSKRMRLSSWFTRARSSSGSPMV